MKLPVTVLSALAVASSVASGVTIPSDWTSQLLPNVSASSNEVYFWPSEANAPNVLMTGKDGFWRAHDGEPPKWTAGDIQPDLYMRSGELFPNTIAGTILVNTSGGSLVAIIFSQTGVQNMPVDTGIASLHCVGCTTTLSSGVVTVHLAYGFTDSAGGEYLGYATRVGNGAWTIKYRYTGAAIVTGAAISATSATDGKIYINYGLNAGQSTLAMTSVSGTQLALPTAVDPGGTGPIFAFAGNLYYCARRDPTNFTVAVRSIAGGSTSPTTVATLPGVSGGYPVTRGVRAAYGSDGAIRVAAYDATQGIVYYSKGATLGKAIDLSGNIANGDLRGFHFTTSGVPVILYRKSLTESYVSYPAEFADADGNGRLDLMDMAFNNSTTAGVTVPPVDAEIDKVTNSANRFKIQFPTIGVPTVSGVTLQNASQNLRYRVEVSTNLSSWAAPTAANFKFAVTGTGSSRTATGVFSDAVPGTVTKRFARVVVERITNDY